jgi:(p)ppGpp synthase/HD superfamily hydrolase
MPKAETPLIKQARKFATRVHDGQFRKNKAREPFINHPKQVVSLVMKAGGSEIEIASAWLHDAIEDGPAVTLKQIRQLFGPEVAKLVDGLTDPPEFKGLELWERKTRQAERLITKKESVKLVKVADQISNVLSVAIDPPVEWGRTKCLAYVAGASLIVDQCVGVSLYLDIAWRKAHLAAAKAIVLMPYQC